MMQIATDIYSLTPESAVEQARSMLEFERTLDTVSDSLFDTIVANEYGPATSLALWMLGDYRTATNTVHTAFERAREDFKHYDGSQSPREWVHGYVNDEVLRRAGGEAA